MDAVYRIANILLGRHNQWEGKHAGGGHAVVQAEHPGVYVHMRHVQQPPQLPEYFQHCQALFLFYAIWPRKTIIYEWNNEIYIYNIHTYVKAKTYLKS